MTTKQLIRKISPAKVCPNKLVRLDVKDAPKEVVLYDVYGVVNKVTAGITDKGEWLKFNGQFEAVTPEEDTFVSGGVFLPEPMQSMMHAELSQALEQDPNASIKFACRVSIVPPSGKVSATGYEYRCIPLIDAVENEGPMAELRKLVAEKKALSLTSGDEKKSKKT